MLIFIHPCSFLYVNDVIKSFQLSYPYHICGESIANCKIWPEGVRIFLIKTAMIYRIKLADWTARSWP